MIYFTSDYHFGHKNITKYRPQFSSVEEMEEVIIKNHNKIVKPNDVIYILGDLTFYNKEKTIEIIKKLSGRKIWIVGNHDSKKVYKKPEVAELFEGIYDFLQIKYKNQKFILCHYPFESWKDQGHGAIHLYGHVHEQVDKLKNIPNRYHVGVDTNDFKPVSIETFF